MGKRIQRIRCLTATDGIVHLSDSWPKEEPLPLYFGEHNIPFKRIEPLSEMEQANLAGYYLDGETARFIVSVDIVPSGRDPSTKLYLAATITDWEKAIGQPDWEMQRRKIEGKEHYVLELPLADLESFSFKFVTGDRQWLEVSEASPNREPIEPGRYNLRFSPVTRGNRLFRFELPLGKSLAKRDSLTWDDGVHRESWPLFYHGDLFKFQSDSPMGAEIADGRTTFRVFAPRADAVKLELSRTPAEQDFIQHDMTHEPDGAWTIDFEMDLSDHLYRYRVAGTNHDEGTAFDPNTPILDPYAKAALSHDGPGIVVSPMRCPKSKEQFEPPAMRDVVIVEAHLRDLLAKSPLPISASDRLGFAGLRQWALDEGNYLRSLGVNAVELQPLQEFDNLQPDEYHWGYMPVNYFSPASAYSSNPSRGSGIEEFRSVVTAFHDAGVAVLIDVVCNHVGLPSHLALLDKAYYFDHDESLEARNWSGCGNDLRRNAPMVRRLLVDSLVHWLETFDVDGFRFDLAELLEAPLLAEIEFALREVKPSVLLVAEPWSFRGRIDNQLLGTSFSSWNDGFRDFIRSYVHGEGDSDGILHYLKGSPDKSFARPAQSVNYVESHDDFSFIDAITENPKFDGRNPTAIDIRRARLALAVTLMAQGVPMLAAGQDFLRSKSGLCNTYLRGDLNVLDYNRLERFRDLHEYCRNWIAFRLSDEGALLRLAEYPKDSFWQEWRSTDGSAAALLLNADASVKGSGLIFAINPDRNVAKLPVLPESQGDACLLATAERFAIDGLTDDFERTNDAEIILPPLQLGLWKVD